MRDKGNAMRLRTVWFIGLIFIGGCAQISGGFMGGFRGEDKVPAAAVASAHPLATEAGQQVLAQGGNAFDAAVAVTAALGVVEPYSSGLGGGGFWLLHRARDGHEVMIDGREKAPGKSRRDMYLNKAGEVIDGLSVDGPLAAGIPGTPAALVHMAKEYGRLPLSATLAPAIRLAREGFPADDYYRRMARFRLEVLTRWPEASRIFLRDGEVPAEGTLIKQPELAEALERLVRDGKEGFYGGPLAARLVEGVRRAGGIWTLDDLAGYEIVERAPIRTQYRGINVTSASPPSSGGVALATMLNILEGYDLEATDDITRKHLIVEAMRRAYRDRAVYLGDPDFVDIPVNRLIHPWYAAGLRASISPKHAMPSRLLPGVENEMEGPHTTHFSIIDQEGNRVAATVTVNYPFGSGFMAPGTGIVLNDEMDDFSAKPGEPNVYGLVGAEANAIAPGKRPLSSMSPTFLDGENGVAVLGTPGGSRIITMVLLGILDYAAGHDPESWVSLGRYHHQYLPDQIQYEPGGLTPEEIQGLEDLGHTLKETGWRYGNMQAILWDRNNNEVKAASDPRGIGEAVVERR